MEPFYSSLTSLSFTLLGLWWAVVSFRKNDWMDDPARRRAAHLVALGFLLPGLMGLLALVSTDPLFWRVTFTTAGSVGALATVAALHAIGPRPELGSVRVGLAVGGVLDGLVVIGAVASGLPAVLGFTIAPLQVEAFLLTLLVAAGANLAWLLFLEAGAPAEH